MLRQPGITLTTRLDEIWCGNPLGGVSRAFELCKGSWSEFEIKILSNYLENDARGDALASTIELKMAKFCSLVNNKTHFARRKRCWEEHDARRASSSTCVNCNLALVAFLTAELRPNEIASLSAINSRHSRAAIFINLSCLLSNFNSVTAFMFLIDGICFSMRSTHAHVVQFIAAFYGRRALIVNTFIVVARFTLKTTTSSTQTY